MFDMKILMILAPIWIASVAVTLFLGFTRPKAAKIINRLLEKGCTDSEKALDRRALELSEKEARALGRGGAFSGLVKATVPSGQETEKRFYIPEGKKEKARAMYGKSAANIWQSLLFSLVLTVFFFGMWLLCSLVFDTDTWQPLFRF